MSITVTDLTKSVIIAASVFNLTVSMSPITKSMIVSIFSLRCFGGLFEISRMSFSRSHGNFVLLCRSKNTCES